MQRISLIIFILPMLLFCDVAVVASEESFSKELLAVRKHILEKEPLEVFNAKVYPPAIRNMIVADIDREGNREVVVRHVPHFRQTAPIVIYLLSKDLHVTRLKEGLAPGPLLPLSGTVLDSHVLGLGADIIIFSKGKPIEHDRVIDKLLGSGFGNIVEYKTFIHGDIRAGNLTYIDMRQADLPHDRDNCEDFEFSRVDGIAFGALERVKERPYLAVQVGEFLWLYHISAFFPNGLMQKELRIEKKPADFLEFAQSSNNVLQYRSRSGRVQPLRFDPPEGFKSIIQDLLPSDTGHGKCTVQ